MKNNATRNTILIAVAALLIGALLTGFVGFTAAPGMMMLEDESLYGFEETVAKFEEEVLAAGWSVAGIHDMQAILDGHGHDVMPIKIYELCSSRYSAEILYLDDERVVSPLMPCRVSIYEKSDGNTYIARMNSTLMAKPFGGVIDDVMQLAAAETEVIIDLLIK